jgi:hypothetical protein
LDNDKDDAGQGAEGCDKLSQLLGVQKVTIVIDDLSPATIVIEIENLYNKKNGEEIE